MEADTKREELVQFVVRVCSDVFLEVLYWGDRRHLVELEKIGRRLHWLVDGHFKQAPFLCLDLYIYWRVFYIKISFVVSNYLLILVTKLGFRGKKFAKLIFCQILLLSASIALSYIIGKYTSRQSKSVNGPKFFCSQSNTQ